MNAIELDRVVKRYGNHLALNGLSMTVPQGSICALIGPNGSGKTTTMGVIAGLLHVDHGSVNVLGDGPFNAARHAGRIGLMPQDAVPSPSTSLVDLLNYYAELQGMDRPKARRESLHCLAKVELSDRAHFRYGELSHGMRRRFSIAQALLGCPKLVLLDEPTSGLDPELVVQIRELIVQLRGEATLLVSSHILSELETMCDYAVFMEQGQAIRQGTMREFTQSNSIVRYTLTAKPNVDAIQLGMQGYSVHWQEPVLSVIAPKSQTLAQTNAICLRLLLDEGVGIHAVESGQSLEKAYLGLKHRSPA